MAQGLTGDVALLPPDTEIRPHAMITSDPWDFEEIYAAFLDSATHYSFDTENEEYLVRITTGMHTAQICWFLLTEVHHLSASLLQTSLALVGSSDEVVAAGVCLIIDLGLNRHAMLTSRFQCEQQRLVSFLRAGIDTYNTTLNKLIDRIERAALRSTDPILLVDPTGVDKSSLAKRTFQPRQPWHLVAGKLIAVNCAVLRGDSAMSTLSDHVKGVFTGMLTARSGLPREADGGALLLDEIAELGLDG